MLHVKCSDEDRVPFISAEIQTAELPHVYIGRPIAKGVTNHLGRWSDELSTIFVTACLVMSLILVTFVALVTTILCSPVVNDLGNFIDERAFNVYYVKEAAQPWSRRELCYVEAAARGHPEMNIYLINLMRTSGARSNTPGADLQARLAVRNANLYSGDFSIEEFFNGSKLSSVARDLDHKLLMLAAKSYLLWNSPGIAMDPGAYCDLAAVNESLRKGRKRDCAPNVSAAVDPTLDLQATEVHCQAFLGFLLRELSRSATRIHSMKDALDRFCLRTDACPEVRVLDLRSKCTADNFDCPTVFASDGINVTAGPYI